MKNRFTKTCCTLFWLYLTTANAQIRRAELSSIKKIESAEVFEPADTETGTIKGRIVTTDNKAAAEVNVTIKETNSYTVTDENGHFVFKNVRTGTYVLLISMVGLQPVEKKVMVTSHLITEVTCTLQTTAKQLEEVIVTSSLRASLRPVMFDKAGIAPINLPQSISIISSKVIADQQANRLGDIIKNVSGVSLTQQRQGVAETFSARGYSIGIGGAGGSIFKNGILTNTMGFPEASVLESVEVLKGSSALMYGNTSGGLIINMVTKKPTFEKGGEVSMRYGSYDLYKPTVDVHGPLSNSLGYRIVATHEAANSYRDVVKTRRTYINPSLLYKPGKKTTLLLQVDYLNANFTPDNGIGILNQNMPAVIPASRSRFINFAWAAYQLNQTSGSLNVNHTLSDNWKLNFIAAAQSTKVNSYTSAVASAIPAGGDFARSLARTKTTESNYTLQLNFTGNFNTGSTRHQFLAGTDAVRISTGTNAFAYYNKGISVGTAYDTINILNPSKFTPRGDIPEARDTALTTSPANRLGVYVQDLVSITDEIKLLAGARWSYIKTFKTSIFNQITHTERKGAAAVESAAFSPKVALIYQPVKTTSFYATYTNSFAANSGVDIYGTQLKPSVTDQFEAGFKNELWKGTLSANISAYRIVNHNFAQIAPLKADGTVNTDTNVKELTGETTSDGFEIDVTGILSKNFYFMTGYGYNYMRYTKTSMMKGANIEGERLVSNPDNTFNTSLFYTFDRTALKGLRLGASAFYTGRRLGGFQNTVGQTQLFNRLITLSDFTTIDFSAGYTYKKVSLLAKLSNSTNTLNYLVHDNYSITPIPPRQLAATLAYKF